MRSLRPASTPFHRSLPSGAPAQPAGSAVLTVRHTVTLDKAAADDASSPTERALEALAASQAETYHAFARRLGIRLDAVTVELHADEDPAGRTGADPQCRPGPRRITGTVRLSSPADRSTLAVLEAAVQRHCPLLDLIRTVTPVRIDIAASH